VSPRPLAVTLGDPAGVGPEITAKAWAALRQGGPAFFVVGDADSIVAAPGAKTPVEQIARADDAARVFRRALPVLHDPLPAPVVARKPDPSAAASVVRWIETATGLALSGAVGGVVTCPIAKKPLYEAGFRFPGHTEFLGELTGAAADPVMMLTARDLRAVLVTVHEPLARVPGLLTPDRVVHVARTTAAALKRDFGLERPRLALAGLNPHAGEGGAIGREELDILAPAVARLRAEGIDVSDPRPADTLFHDDARRGYDAAVCLYHDQALIPVKTLDFWGGVNVTLGLPIVRTSPDHGAGFDAAGRGTARPDSLIAAIRLASEIAARRAVVA
jgi:4-hydroxythreonine-4-phosphate dehydrogenase